MSRVADALKKAGLMSGDERSGSSATLDSFAVQAGVAATAVETPRVAVRVAPAPASAAPTSPPQVVPAPAVAPSPEPKPTARVAAVFAPDVTAPVVPAEAATTV